MCDRLGPLFVAFEKQGTGQAKVSDRIRPLVPEGIGRSQECVHMDFGRRSVAAGERHVDEDVVRVPGQVADFRFALDESRRPVMGFIEITASQGGDRQGVDQHRCAQPDPFLDGGFQFGFSPNSGGLRVAG